jgi:hypothetical protein
MNKGIVIYAHNNRKVDYALMSLIAGGLAKRHLQVPVSLITDESTVSWMKESGIHQQAESVFDQIILTDRPDTNNQRRLYDGVTDEVVPFINADRYSVWELTPYERTLLIDSDFLIFSNQLNEYWDVDQDVMIGNAINDIYDQKRLGYHDRYVSDTGIKLYWATTVMFTKNQTSKFFFDTVAHVKENYRYYADLYRFDSRQYRNDISFSVAKHIMEGFEATDQQMLPPVLTALDRDVLAEVSDKKLTFLVNYNLDNNFCAAALSNIDVHVMNKQSIHRNKDQLLELI